MAPDRRVNPLSDGCLASNPVSHYVRFNRPKRGDGLFKANIDGALKSYQLTIDLEVASQLNKWAEDIYTSLQTSCADLGSGEFDHAVSQEEVDYYRFATERH